MWQLSCFFSRVAAVCCDGATAGGRRCDGPRPGGGSRRCADPGRNGDSDFRGSGKTLRTTSKTDGTYSVRVAPGDVYVDGVGAGLCDFSEPGINVTNGANVASDVKMTLQDTTQTVTVSTDTVQLSVDPENNASATVITGDALNALSDDPDELSAELAALAGPSAGPNGGQIYIDGFTGGQLPPKASILAIRINQNPFSAQYDQPGYGRIEIITKPGTDQFHGGGSFQFRTRYSIRRRRSWARRTCSRTITPTFIIGNLTGPIRPGMSFTIAGTYRDIANNNIINPRGDLQPFAHSTAVCSPGFLPYTDRLAANPYPLASRAIAAPQKRWEINPRIDTMIGSKNTLTARYAYETANITSPGSNNNLPTQGTTS